MKKQSKGFTLVELIVVVGILGILMAVLSIAVSSIAPQANNSHVAMHGRNLFVAITRCNTDREAEGLQSVWPQQSTKGLNANDAKLIGASSSTEFFRYLFDFDNKGNAAKWKPYVDVDIGVLSGGGVPGASGTSLKPDNVAWLVLKNYASEMSDVVPVLMTRNASRTAMNAAIRGKVEGNESTEIKCGKGAGERDTPFGNKGWVLVRKGGGAQVIKAKYSKYSIIFNRQGFDNSNLENKPEFLPLE